MSIPVQAAASVAPCDSVSESGRLVGGSAAIVPAPSTAGVVGLVPPAAPDFAGVSAEALPSYVSSYALYSSAYSKYCETTQALVPGAACSAVEVTAPSWTSVSSPASSHLSSTAGSASSGLSASRLRSARRAAKWRGKEMSSKKLPDGLCYARLFRYSVRQSLAQECGFWPTVGELLTHSSDLFSTSLVATDVLRLVKRGSAFHVTPPSGVLSGEDSVSLNAALLGLAKQRSFPLGSYGADLADLAKSIPDAELSRELAMDSRLGGNEVEPWPTEVKADVIVYVFGTGVDDVSSIRSWFEPFSSEMSVAVLVDPLCVRGAVVPAGMNEEWREAAVLYSDIVVHMPGSGLVPSDEWDRAASVHYDKLVRVCEPGSVMYSSESSRPQSSVRIFTASGFSLAARGLCRRVKYSGEDGVALDSLARDDLSLVCRSAFVPGSKMVPVTFPYSEFSNVRYVRTELGDVCLVHMNAGFVDGVLPMCTSRAWSSQASRAARGAVVCEYCGTVSGYGCCEWFDPSVASGLRLRFFLPEGVPLVSFGASRVLHMSFVDRVLRYLAGAVRAKAAERGGASADFESYMTFISVSRDGGG